MQENIGRGSPAPTYEYTDNIKYKEMPSFSFGQEGRLTDTKAKYDHYDHVLFFDEPAEADNKRRPTYVAPKIGTEPRMQAGIHDNENPGPQYAVNQKPEAKKYPLYTFGYKRGQAGLKVEVSTPGAVGPGRYVPEAAANPSTK